MASQISANEYPYNLQGDQTKARQLASQAQSGDAGALDSLRQLGLDARGNLVTTGPVPIASTPSYLPTPTVSAPSVSTPSLPPKQGTVREPLTRMAAEPTKAAVPAAVPAAPAYGAARNPVPADPFKAQQPFVDPKTQLQRDRLSLDQAKFEDAQKRYTDQQEAAAQRIQQSQQTASPSRSGPMPSTPVKSGGGGGSGGTGGNSAMKSNIKDGIKTPPKPTQPAAKSSKGGGGGGRGGQSPEQKARDKAREGRQMEREKDRDRKMEDWNKTPEQKARKNAKTASEFYKMRDEGKPGKGGQSTPEMSAPFDRSKPVSNPYIDGPREFPNASEYEKYMRDRLAKEAERMKKAIEKDEERIRQAAEDDSGGGGQPKMVQAWGNKHSTVWVKARGDK
jgi:hypothetical protein